MEFFFSKNSPSPIPLKFLFNMLQQALILCSNHSKKIMWNVEELLHY